MQEKRKLHKSFLTFTIFGVLILLGLSFMAFADLSDTITVLLDGNSGAKGGNTSITRDSTAQTINLTVSYTGTTLANITNITILIPSNFTFHQREGDNIGFNDSDGERIGNITSLTLWECSNITANVLNCNTSTGTGNPLGTGLNTSLTIVFNITPDGNALELDDLSTTDVTQVNFTINTTDDFGTPVANQTYFILPFDGLAPQVTTLNISDGNTTYIFNDTLTLKSAVLNDRILLKAGNVWTVSVLLTDINLQQVRLFYQINDSNVTATVFNSTSGSSPSAVTNFGSADSGVFTGTIPAADTVSGNNITFFVTANDSVSHSITTFDILGGTYEVRANGSLVSIETVNVSDSSGNVLTNSSGLSGADDFINAELPVIIQAELSGLRGSAGTSPNVTIYFSKNGTSLVPGVNGGVIDFQFIQTMSAMTHDGGTGSVVYNTSINVSSADTGNTTYFVIVANTTTAGMKHNYSATFGPYSFIVDTAQPGTPTITLPGDIDISISGSVKYTCAANDDTSSVTFTWVATKPDGTTVTKTGSSATFSGTETNQLGTYTVKCTATDQAGNQNSYTTTPSESFRVLSSSGGGGAGGGGGTAAGPSFDVDFSTSSSGSVSVASGSSRTISFDGSTTHTLTVDEVTETSATITIASHPVTITLEVGETGNVDVNDDGVDDMSVTLDAINNGVAELSVEKLEGAAVVAEEEEAAAEEEGAPTGEPTPTPVSEKTSSRAGLWITLVVIVIVLVVGYFILRRK